MHFSYTFYIEPFLIKERKHVDIIVRPGDSLWHFSEVFKIPLQLILDSNKDINPQFLRVGQRVRIPGFVTNNYQIKQGDSFWQIAQSRNLPLVALLLVNPDLNPNRLQIGQMIRIPQRITWRLVDGKQNYTYTHMMNDLRKLLDAYPFLHRSNIGSSVLGKELPELTIGHGAKRVHYNGSFHANEWITTPIILTFLNDYLLALTNHSSIRGISPSSLYQQTFLSIVPMVNPDGVDLVIQGPPNDEALRNQLIAWNNDNADFSGWKANIHGIDLNDQFPAKWELESARNPTTPGPRDYGGERPLSEPEAIAMADLTKQGDFSRVLAFHTQGRVIYWGFENLEPPESEVLVNEFSRVSGYEPVQSAGSYAGYKDWFIQDWRRPGFTVELGSGTNPLPISQFDDIYEESLGIFLAALYM